eukprot:CAMPEP_0182854868 /NCGR_PEP_ID=MMETSP0034_2-20130328/1509_1 /TAXON_ID=156128 /ORGANISM="Nephroselmis pyriformis, Strain CCMP717" /LENGTH=53 /DNA_ID=CAMNT_0024985757 /DNA_START=787 /DNA_END=948 /DNA_ORIENTATION=+
MAYQGKGFPPVNPEDALQWVESSLRMGLYVAMPQPVAVGGKPEAEEGGEGGGA